MPYRTQRSEKIIKKRKIIFLRTPFPPYFYTITVGSLWSNISSASSGSIFLAMPRVVPLYFCTRQIKECVDKMSSKN